MHALKLFQIAQFEAYKEDLNSYIELSFKKSSLKANFFFLVKTAPTSLQYCLDFS